MSAEKCLGGQRIKSTFPLTCSEEKGDKQYAKKGWGGMGTKHREDSGTLLFSTVLVVNTTSLNKKQGTKVYFTEVHVFPKSVFCDFFYLNGLRVHLLRTQVYSCYGILHHGLLIIGAVSFISATKSCKIIPKQTPLFLQALGNHRPHHLKIFFLAFP